MTYKKSPNNNEVMWIVGIVFMCPFSWHDLNLYWRKFSFILDWRVEWNAVASSDKKVKVAILDLPPHWSDRPPPPVSATFGHQRHQGLERRDRENGQASIRVADEQTLLWDHRRKRRPNSLERISTTKGCHRRRDTTMVSSKHTTFDFSYNLMFEYHEFRKHQM